MWNFPFSFLFSILSILLGSCDGRVAACACWLGPYADDGGMFGRVEVLAYVQSLLVSVLSMVPVHVCFLMSPSRLLLHDSASYVLNIFSLMHFHITPLFLAYSS
ncbi:hypothetical protein B0H21DRAFT_775446 [Amylocystis lapponica]|nr:hypothetical protein B0H21DRAFT_775446 [Amylocystis lapponica]